MKLLVRNLNRKTTEVNLKSLFKKYGIVESSTLVIDEKTKLSKGFGFVVMSDDRDGKKAIKDLDGKVVEGNKIRVKPAKEVIEANEESGN